MKDKFYSWDFDENLIYVFECHSPKNVGDETYVTNPFNNNYKLTQKFFSHIERIFEDMNKYLSKDSYLEIVFYQFNKTPLDVCKFCDFNYLEFSN